MRVDYKIYPSLLDSYTNYLASRDRYDKYWGFSANPPCTPEEWEQKQFQELIDSINRVPFESVYSDQGTAFNEVVDVMLTGKPSYRIKMDRLYRVKTNSNTIPYNEEVRKEVAGIRAYLNGRTYQFPIKLVRHFYDLYKGQAIPQVYVEGILETRLGVVELYGYLDELMPFGVHDIKTTGRYEPWKFKANSQHLVYPYCLHQMGSPIGMFTYDVAEITSNAKQEQERLERGMREGAVEVTSWTYHKEEYAFDYATAEEELRRRCEDLIQFLEWHRADITNEKVFGGA